MERWNPWNAVIAVVLTAGVYVVERHSGLDPMEALIAAAVAGFASLVMLEYWKG